MITTESSAVDAKLKEMFGAILDDSRYSLADLAAAMSLPPEKLSAWYAGELEAKDLPRVEEAVAGYLRSRELAGICWRCGCSLELPISVESEIARAERSAAWAGWSREDFVLKCRSTMKPGDRILFIYAGRFLVRHPDGRIATITLLDG